MLLDDQLRQFQIFELVIVTILARISCLIDRSAGRNLNNLGSGKMFLIYMGESMTLNFYPNGGVTVDSTVCMFLAHHE